MPEHMKYVRQLLASNQYSHRTEFAGVVCEYFEFLDPRGKNQLGGCLKALRELEETGEFVLPAVHYKSKGPRSSPQPRRLSEPLFASPKRAVSQPGFKSVEHGNGGTAG